MSDCFLIMYNNQLDIFTPIAYQDEILGSEYYTLTGDTRTGPIIFKLQNSKDYLDLSQSILRLKLKITNHDGTVIGAKVDQEDSEVAIVNNVLHSIFSDVTVNLNNKRIEGGKGLYAYKTYISTVFRMHEQAIKNQVFTQGWAKDQYDKMDDVKNTGFVTRKAWTAEGVEKEFYGKLEVDFFKQDRLLIPGVDMEICLDRAKDSFAICTTNSSIKPTIVITSAQLQLKVVKINPQIMLQHVELLNKEVPAIYPINRTVINYMILKKDDKEIEFEELFNGRIPKYMLMCLVPKTAFFGDYTKNPFAFKHYNLTNVSLKKDRYPFPYEEFKPDFKNKKCIREYISIFQSNNIFGKDETLAINYEEFLEGYTHFQWNLTADGRGKNSQPDERGNMVLKLDFKEHLTEAVVIILYGVFDGTVYVYGNGDVQTDYDS